MKKTTAAFLLMLPLSLTTYGCTQNERAKAFGGTQTITLAQGEKVVNVTWKNADMWILVELPNGAKEFREYSNWGVMNGKVVFK